MTTELASRTSSDRYTDEIDWTTDFGVCLKIAAAYNRAGTSVQANPGQGKECLGYQTFGREEFEGRADVQVMYSANPHTDEGGVYGVKIDKHFDPFNGGRYKESWFVPLIELQRYRVRFLGRRLA